ncbi:hypothetical protein SDC9_113458 [bioreactor metagenome]|uniref:Uncharacterized protein n=1 Tax=bioreactor metagenome TaxID=1076179 RepID=A0A645BM44_9ZZZZ
MGQEDGNPGAAHLARVNRVARELWRGLENGGHLHSRLQQLVGDNEAHVARAHHHRPGAGAYLAQVHHGLRGAGGDDARQSVAGEHEAVFRGARRENQIASPAAKAALAGCGSEGAVFKAAPNPRAQQDFHPGLSRLLKKLTADGKAPGAGVVVG